MVNGNRIHASKKIQLEEAIMNENALRFVLAYSYLIFHKSIIKLVRKMGQTIEARQLVYDNILISTYNNEINKFLSLLYEPNHAPIPVRISLERWNNH